MSKDREPEPQKILIVTTDGFIQHPPDICREILQELQARETQRKMPSSTKSCNYIPWLYEIDQEPETSKTQEEAK